MIALFDPSAQMLAINDELGEKVFPKNIIQIGPFAVNDSVLSGFVVVAALLVAALVLRLTIIRKWKTTPTGGQMFLEWLVSFFDKSADEMTENYSGLMRRRISAAACSSSFSGCAPPSRTCAPAWRSPCALSCSSIPSGLPKTGSGG